MVFLYGSLWFQNHAGPPHVPPLIGWFRPPEPAASTTNLNGRPRPLWSFNVRKIYMWDTSVRFACLYDAIIYTLHDILYMHICMCIYTYIVYGIICSIGVYNVINIMSLIPIHMVSISTPLSGVALPIPGPVVNDSVETSYGMGFIGKP